MTIHVHIGSQVRNACVTDMTNAGKRGKTCRVLWFSGCPAPTFSADTECVRAGKLTNVVLGQLQRLPESADFDEVVELLTSAVAYARSEGIGDRWFSFHEDQPIRAIAAPRPVLTAGNDKWSGKADENGIHLSDLTDDVNQPAMCSNQSHARAYKLAAKVWDQVKQAQTMDDASKILRAAGCRLLYYFAMD